MELIAIEFFKDTHQRDKDNTWVDKKSENTFTF